MFDQQPRFDYVASVAASIAHLPIDSKAAERRSRMLLDNQITAIALNNTLRLIRAARERGSNSPQSQPLTSSTCSSQ